MIELVSKKKVKVNNGYRTPTILQCFLDADLRGSHNSLAVTGKKYGIDVPNLLPGQVVIFINKRRTLMKCCVEGNTFSYTRRDRIDLSAISRLPQAFGATGELNYDKALEIALIDKLGLKEETRRSIRFNAHNENRASA